MPRLFNKILLSFLASLVVLFSFAPFFEAKAATPGPSPSAPIEGSWYNQDFGQWYGKVYDDKNPSEIFGERYTAAQVQWVVYGLISFILNSTTNANILSCVIKNATDLNQCKDSISKITSTASPDLAIIPKENNNLLSFIFATNRPFSGISYVKNVITKFNLVSEVSAASTSGFGFDSLLLVQNMWRSFRDIAYGLFVIVAIVFAFMIMFRVKISPQLVISVQSALPKIITSLILVTFSYAIAGFLIDFMYVVIGLMSLIMAPLIPFVPILQPTPHYQAIDVFKLLTLGPTMAATPGITAHAGGILGLLGIYLGPLILLLAVIMIIGFIASETGVGAVVGFIFLALLIIVLIVDIWMSIKIFFALFKAFANVLLLTIFAPIQLVLGALVPNFGFGQWVKNYLSNLSVFIVTGVLLLFAWIFSLQAWMLAFSGGSNLNLSTPAENPWPPLIGTGGPGWTVVLLLGVSFVLFTLIPKATEIVQGFISGKPFAYGSAIGETLSPITTAGGMYTGSQLQNYDVKAKAAGMSTLDYVNGLSSIEKARYWAAVGGQNLIGSIGGGKRR